MIDTVIVGAGHAGLALSYYLTRNGNEHIVLERGDVAERWRTERWDFLVFQRPNWSLQLPGHAYQGSDPDGSASKDQFIRFLEDYASIVRAPQCAAIQRSLPCAKHDPIHERGVTKRAELYFLGLRRTYSIGSALVAGAANDAAYIADHIASLEGRR